LMGARLEGFKVIKDGTRTAQEAIRLTTSYMTEINQVHIDGMTGHGIVIPTVLGDNDGSNMVKLKQVRIENCTGWGIKSDGDSGRNEFSFFHLEQVFIQACGTTSAAATPPSGGMIWKGQIMSMDQCAFTLNNNCALFIPGQSGLGQTVYIYNTTFENNIGRNIYSTGISLFVGQNIQQYHNDSFVGTDGIEFDGASFVVRNITLDGNVVRATSGNNAFTAFKLSGANTDFSSCRVKNVVWDNFDYSGQTRFDGWLFDHVENSLVLQTSSGTSLTLRPKPASGSGGSAPLRLRGGGGGTPSTTGEWIEYQTDNSGLTISNSGLSASTTYYCYLYDNSGVTALELSTTAPANDSTTGYRIKTGDATRTYVGAAVTDGSSEFETTATGWLNPTVTYDGPQGGVAVYTWADTSTTKRVKYAVAPTSNTDGTAL
jgi:hypothetical protein